jgi:hypothetical protein
MPTQDQLDYMASMGFSPKGGSHAKLNEVKSKDSAALNIMLSKPYKRKKSKIEENLENQTLQIGFGTKYDIDTGIPLSPKATAGLIGLGDQIGDVWRGTAQLLKEQGIADLIDEEVQDQNEEIIRKLYADPKFGTAAKTGAVVGAIAEPVGFLIPGLKFGKTTSAVAYAAVAGGLYGSALYVDGEESRIKNAALGLAFGGALGGLSHKFFRGVVG